MARKITILDRSLSASEVNVQVAFWLDVPADQQVFYASSGKASVVPAATSSEVAAIRSGAIFEVEQQHTFDRALTAGQIRNQVENRFDTLQTSLNTGFGWLKVGAYFDGATWVQPSTGST